LFALIDGVVRFTKDGRGRKVATVVAKI